MSIGSPEKMEPITKVSHIPSSRWALLCSLCEDKVGAAIQVGAHSSSLACFTLPCPALLSLNNFNQIPTLGKSALVEAEKDFVT